MEVRYGFVIRG